MKQLQVIMAVDRVKFEPLGIEPFNYQKYLDGYGVITRDGQIVNELKIFKDVPDKIFGVIKGDVLHWQLNGEFLKQVGNYPLDLFIQKQSFTELTAVKTLKGWRRPQSLNFISSINKIIYVGECRYDGDMFVIHREGYVNFCCGHLNNGILKL